MRATNSRHPPGLIITMTGELARYSDSMADLEALRVPLGAGRSWFRGVLIAEGLNKALKGIYAKPDFEWAWIMGDDHRLEEDVVLRLLDREVDVIIPMCVHRHPPFYSTVVGIKEDGSREYKPVSDFPTAGLYKLKNGEACGDAGMLIRKRVLDAIPEPWYDNLRSGSFSSDDLCFSQRIQDYGFDVHVDCEVVIGHTTPMTITPRVVDGEWKMSLTTSDKPVATFGVRRG